MDKKIIITTGNIGKTVLSFYLSQLISLNHKTILISSDGTKPIYACLFPQRKKEKQLHSLGKLLSLPVITQDDIFQNANLINKNLLMLSYGIDESAANYPEITNSNLTTMFTQLQETADVIIVDSSTAHCAIDVYALSVDDSIEICVTSADVRGLYYRNFHPNPRKNILWQNSPYNSMQDIMPTFGSKSPIVLPYCKNFGGIYNGMDIDEVFPARSYKKTLLRIVGDLL